MIKNKKEHYVISQLLRLAAKLKRNKGMSAAFVISFVLLSALTYLSYYENALFSDLDIGDFEIGMVADRDIVSNKNIEYIDEKATEIRRKAARHSVTAVFDKDPAVGVEYIKNYLDFSALITEVRKKTKNPNEFKFMVLEKYPTVLGEAELESLFGFSALAELTDVAGTLLKKMYDEGIADMSVLGIEGLNDSKITVIVRHNDTQSYENVPIEAIIAYGTAEPYIRQTLEEISKPAFEKEAAGLLKPFIKPNILYNAKETEKRIFEALSQVKPVTVTINKNQRILRRGFVINEETYGRLAAYSEESDHIDMRHFAGAVIFLGFAAAVSLFLLSKNIAGKSLGFGFNLLILIFFDFVYVLFLFLSKLNIFVMPFNLVPVLPVAFFAMLMAALTSQKTAVNVIFILSMAVFGATDYKMTPALFSMFSGLVATALIHIIEKRLDLIKTACLLALIQPIMVICFMVIFKGLTNDATAVILGSALNGFLCGIFVQGFLPVLEVVLNVPTSFRLKELSDLNSSIMQKMLVNISGTYNHSMMVATLAETACQNIGANALLARVGAYYHDIGKMDNGEYFTENQTLYNKHIELNPRLSATVIRSHVRLGIEKARQLRLPEQVIDIIAEHHGNSLVSYFYAKAKEQDPSVNPEDFAYPGTPPRTKESAVVMLADTVEAACHSMEHPTGPNIEKFIENLVAKKIEAGQLDNSDLTLREIKIIKDSFLKVLIGYYHTRIQYPNQKKFGNDEKNNESNKEEDTHDEKNKKEEESEIIVKNAESGEGENIKNNG